MALVLALLIRSYLFQPFRIPSGSMRMTLVEGDRLFVNKLAYGASLIPVELRSFSSADADPRSASSWGRFLRTRLPGFSKPKRGDVVVFRYPVMRDKDFIKRLIAVGGDTVEIRDGKILINDQPVTDGTIAKLHYYNNGDYGMEGKKVKVPEGYFFVLGDNSASSHDSRYWGFVPEHFIIGKAELIFWPPNRMRWIE
ncbi:MAG: signal peptidase I [Candidatus Omnitrophica bacterium]|nr:signal peptidase I [Candidatus Omnitrophota bacterium]